MGNAIVFLQTHEESFVKFIEANQKVPLQQMEQLQIQSDVIPRGM